MIGPRGRRRVIRAVSISILASAILVATGVLARARRDANLLDERAIAACIHRAARGHGWLEKTLWGLRDQEAGWIGAEIVSANGSHDLGPLQINSWWVTKIANATRRPAENVRWWLSHDACFNVEAARWIFLSGLAKSKSYWGAIGIYHSPTVSKQSRYSSSVADKLEKRFGANTFYKSAQPLKQSLDIGHGN